jgi:non-specific serine/threonine protein kinase
VLDNCEHVIDAVAPVAEMLVRLCQRATILATSREPFTHQSVT